MRTTDKRKLNRLIRESFEDGYSNLGQTPIALLGIEDIIDLIMLTIAAMKSENLIPSVSERQKEKVTHCVAFSFCSFHYSLKMCDFSRQTA